MSALAFLSGLSQSAGDEYSKVADQKRLLTNSNNQALAETIHQRLETDNGLDFPTYRSLRAQEYKLRGVPAGDIEQLLQHEKSVWDVAQQHKNASVPSITSTPPSINSTPNPGAVSPATGDALPPLPGGQGINSPGLGPTLPGAPASPVTSGEKRTAFDVAHQNAINEAAIQKQREQFQLFNQETSGGGDVEPTTGVHYLTQTTMGPNGPQVSRKVDSGQNIPGIQHASDILARDPKATLRGGAPLPTDGYFRGTKYGNQDVIYDPAVAPTTAKIVFDPTSPTRFSYQKVGPRNEEIGPKQPNAPPPAGLVERETDQGHEVTFIDPNTNQRVTQVLHGTSTNKPIISSGPTGPLPGLEGVKPITKVSVTPRIVPTLIGGVAKTSQLGPQGDLRVQIKVPQKGSPLDVTNPIDRKAFFEGIDTKMADSIKIPKGLENAFQNRIAEFGIIPNEVDSADRSRSQLAITLLPHIEEVQKLIEEAKAKGEYGTLKTRWNDFLTGKVGQDTSEGKIFSRIATNLAFLGTATAMVHGGLRGGSSPGMIDHWDQAIKAPDPDTALNELKVVHEWISGYKNIARSDRARTVGGGTLGPTPTGNIPTSNSSVIDQLLKDHGFGQ